MQAFCADVYSILSDMGVEIGLCNAPDVMAQWLRGESLVSDAILSYMFPMALRVPDWNHIIDNAFQETLLALVFWDALHTIFKEVVTFMNLKQNRQELKRLCGENKAAAVLVGRHIKALAHWRWGTVAFNLRRLRAAWPCLCRIFRPQDWKHVKYGKVGMLHAISNKEWQIQLNICDKIAELAEDMRNWGITCQTHPNCQDKLCPYKGRNLHLIPARVSALKETVLRYINEELWEDAGEDADRAFEFRTSLEGFVYKVDSKTDFASQLPYAFTRADTKEGCEEVLGLYVDLKTRGIEPDRISNFFLGESSELAEHVEDGRQTGVIHPNQNWYVQAYKSSSIDGSRSEGIHAGSTRTYLRASASKLAWVCGTQRLPSTIKRYRRWVAKGAGGKYHRLWVHGEADHAESTA